MTLRYLEETVLSRDGGILCYLWARALTNVSRPPSLSRHAEIVRRRASSADLMRVVEWVGYEEHFLELFWRDGTTWKLPCHACGNAPEVIDGARVHDGLPPLLIERLGFVLRPADGP